MRSDLFAVRDTIAQALDHTPLSDLPVDLRGTAELVLAEVLNNIVEHAHRGPDGRIELTILRTESGVQCTLHDDGLPMPGQTPPPGWFPDDDAAGYPAEGGYGWYLIRELTDHLCYVRLAGQNRLTFELNAKQSN